jgi:hypothetical protein
MFSLIDEYNTYELKTARSLPPCLTSIEAAKISKKENLEDEEDDEIYLDSDAETQPSSHFLGRPLASRKRNKKF